MEILKRRHVNWHHDKRLSILSRGKIQIKITIPSYYSMSAITEKVGRFGKKTNTLLGTEISSALTESCMEFSYKNGSVMCYAAGWVCI